MQRGDIVAGRFEVERLADAGAMASVYRAQDYQTGAIVALKLIGDTRSDDAGKIKEAGYRASFLEQVPENARTLELASAWGA